ncbi:DUF4297 domain-containing protein [Bacillus licheniformis]|uniref:DUF4297 domain-containing protein n=1 Tax=Bacillus licheniformis TaxID=1402 RepID=UPI0015E381B6|nr:DUF4297 domain-containing protein [Bacillus licheniformis]MBA1162005.1 DUF4297 domain-containing protein [Bacillus licheniformis]
MDLKQKISEQRPRETSGSRSSNRFDYQKDWAILKLIELYKTRQDFLLIMDYYDDIVVFNSEKNPEKIEFFQVKTSKSNWTLNKLLKRRKGENGLLPSIIGKMYGCKMQFPNNTLSLNFVSNSYLNIDLKDKDAKSLSKKRISFTELCDQKLKEIINQLKEEHSLKKDPDFIEITFFMVSDLIISDRETYVKGKLSDFLEELDPKGTFKISLVYNTLFDEVKRKNNYEGNVCDFEELSKRKGIGHSHFNSIIKNFIGVENKVEKMWSLVENRLNSEGVPMIEILELKESWDTYKIEKMEFTNHYLQKIRKIINEIITPYRTNNLLYSEIIEPAYQDFVSIHKDDLYTEHYIKIIILMEYLGI